MDAEPITVLLVDDHPVVRQGLGAMLRTDPQIAIVGEAGGGLAALTLVAHLAPRIVLMDIHMPEMDGLTATRQIKERSPRTAVIMLTLYNNEQYILAALQAGAGGYLLKNASREEILSTIHAVADGGMVLTATTLTTVLMGTRTASPLVQGQPGDAEYLEPLSHREQEVLTLVVAGHTNKEIGGALHIAEDTAKKHVQNIILKLQASDRTHAAVVALRRGLVP